jgi:hypothetical protein
MYYIKKHVQYFSSIDRQVSLVFFFQQHHIRAFLMCAVDLGFYTTQGCRLSPMQFESLRDFSWFLHFSTTVHGTEFAFDGQRPSVAWALMICTWSCLFYSFS